MLDLSLQTILLLAAAAFGAGFIDAVAGGGGLIAVPALLLAGLPPVDALGTNKLQALFGSGSATLAYARQGRVNPREQAGAAALAFAGSILGAVLATVLPGDLLRAALPVMLVGIALYFAFKRNLDDEDRARRISPAMFTATVPLGMGIYDGVFGPGTGSFLMLAFVSLAGYGLVRATAHTKLLNFASNLGALLAFAVVGAVWWQVGFAMGAAQFVGAQLGARFAVRGGARVIRPLLVAVCVALALKLLFDQFGG